MEDYYHKGGIVYTTHTMQGVIPYGRILDPIREAGPEVRDEVELVPCNHDRTEWGCPCGI